MKKEKKSNYKARQSKNLWAQANASKSRLMIDDFIIHSHLCRLGRRGAMMAGAVMFAFSYLVLVLAPNVWFVYIGR